MVSFAFGTFSVTSWGPTTPDGHVWRARNAERMVEFLADRDAPVEDLYRKAAAALEGTEKP